MNEQKKSDEMEWTWVHHYSDHEWPFLTSGYIYHRKDLGDLKSPYLEMVRESKARKA